MSFLYLISLTKRQLNAPKDINLCCIIWLILIPSDLPPGWSPVVTKGDKKQVFRFDCFLFFFSLHRSGRRMRTRLDGVAANRRNKRVRRRFFLPEQHEWFMIPSVAPLYLCNRASQPVSTIALLLFWPWSVVLDKTKKGRKKKMANNLSIITTRFLLSPRCCLLITFNPSVALLSPLWFPPAPSFQEAKEKNNRTTFFFSFLLCGSSVSAAFSRAAAVIHPWQPAVSESLLFLLLCGCDAGRCLIYPTAPPHNRPPVVVVVAAAATVFVCLFVFNPPLLLSVFIVRRSHLWRATLVCDLLWDARIKTLNTLRRANSVNGLLRGCRWRK